MPTKKERQYISSWDRAAKKLRDDEPAGEPADEMAAIFAELQQADEQRSASFIKAQIRNAISEIEDGDEEAAIATLKAIVGDDL